VETATHSSADLEELRCQIKLQNQQEELEKQQKALEQKMNEFAEIQKTFKEQQERHESRINALGQSPTSCPTNVALPAYATGATQVDFKANTNCPYFS